MFSTWGLDGDALQAGIRLAVTLGTTAQQRNILGAQATRRQLRHAGFETIGLVEHAGHAAVALSCHCFDVFAGDCHGRLRKGGALSAPG